MTIATRIFTKFKGQLVGTDEFGNRYYQLKKADKFGRFKRWVMYDGIAEPSKVPPAWHGWLHYTTNEVKTDKYNWQKEHTPNLTGTKNANFPKGDARSVGQREKVASDYHAWNPDSLEE